MTRLGMKRDALADLIARVEAAEAPSVDLFYAVATKLLPDTFPSLIDHDYERVEWRVNVFGKFVSAGAWTDAAFALVERVLGQQSFRIIWLRANEVDVEDVSVEISPRYFARAKTLPLALILATLGAIQASNSPEPSHEA